MDGIDARVSEIIENPNFRNVIHLVVIVSFGYLLMKLLLYIMDAAHIGLGWLAAHQDGGFLIIILFLALSVLAVDTALCMGCRRMGDVRYSFIEQVISAARDRIQAQDGGQGMPELGQRMHTHKTRDFYEIYKPRKTRAVQKTAQEEVLESISVEAKENKPVVEETTVQEKPVTDKKPASPEILFTESLRFPVSRGKRVVIAFDSEHNITVLDFISRVSKCNVLITVESLKEHRSVKPVGDCIIYQYCNIWVDLTNENIENAVVGFKVKRDWMTSNNVISAQLREFTRGNWTLLPTKRIGKDEQYFFFEAKVPALSVPFAVTGK